MLWWVDTRAEDAGLRDKSRPRKRSASSTVFDGEVMLDNQ